MTMFECTESSNVRLQMWKKIEDGKISVPAYHPNVANRTAFEQRLDDKALAMVNRIYPWQNGMALMACGIMRNCYAHG